MQKQVGLGQKISDVEFLFFGEYFFQLLPGGLEFSQMKQNPGEQETRGPARPGELATA